MRFGVVMFTLSATQASNSSKDSFCIRGRIFSIAISDSEFKIFLLNFDSQSVSPHILLEHSAVTFYLNVVIIAVEGGV